jgi:hypothetical protein
MISLVSGLFAVYFAILKFLGAEDISKPKVQAIVGIVGLPPMLFVLSIIAFVFAVLPLCGRLSLNLRSSIQDVRRNYIIIKYLATIAGLSLFLLAMYYMMIINLRLVFG